jgi:tetratricopeptide (TPR) repeat protein
MYRVIFTSILFLLCCKVFSQELTSDVIEKRIIINASNNQEDSLKYFYNYAKLHNVVSNKMNTFLGDFYLQRKKYSKALKYYEASYKRDSYNINTHYGLYICYGYLGMADQQNLLADKFTIAQCEFYEHKKSKLESVSFYSGTLISNNFQKNKNIDLAGSNKYFGSIDRNGSLQYLYASAQYRVTNRFTVLASINVANELIYAFSSPATARLMVDDAT